MHISKIIELSEAESLKSWALKKADFYHAPIKFLLHFDKLLFSFKIQNAYHNILLDS